MPSQDAGNPATIRALAERHGLSVGAVRALAEALAAGRGGSAQWNHPDLGGMGQWMSGRMLQIGDMFNHALKARVAAALDELALSNVAEPVRPAASPPADRAWWPAGLGEPAASGAQNAMRYACFPDRRRLAVERDGRLTIYDTGSRRLTGFAQSQSDRQHLVFGGPDGAVTLAELAIVPNGPESA